jgi:uncharacterized membrane protein
MAVDQENPSALSRRRQTSDPQPTRGWWAKITRFLRHRWMDEGDAIEAVGMQAIERLEEMVRQSEVRHRGEVRLCIEASLPLWDLWHGTTARQRALHIFSELQVWDTEENNGVLVYLLLADRKIEIVADRGINRQVPPASWRRIVQGMSELLHHEEWERALGLAVAQATQHLEALYSVQPGARNPNELPNRPVVR